MGKERNRLSLVSPYLLLGEGLNKKEKGGFI